MPLLMAFTCGEEVKYPNDRLNDIGIFGTWEISDQSINGISDLTVKCCKFLDFTPDDDKQDFRGRFTYREDGQQMAAGFFIVDPSQETVFFEWDKEKDLVYQYKFNDSMDFLTFSFSEDGSDFVEGWSQID